MSTAQQEALEAIKAAGGSVVRLHGKWSNGLKLNLTTTKSLVRCGALVRIEFAVGDKLGTVASKFEVTS